MSKHGKTLQAMRNNPRDWRMDQLESVAAHLGLKIRKPGGSHVIFQKDGCPLEVSVPARRPIKPVYVTQFVEMIDWSQE